MSDNLIEMRQISLSWKTRVAFDLWTELKELTDQRLMNLSKTYLDGFILKH